MTDENFQKLVANSTISDGEISKEFGISKSTVKR